MSAQVCIAYITGRRVPRWEWFVNSLVAQVPNDMRSQVEILVIDGCLWSTHASKETSSEIAISDTGHHDPARRVLLADLLRGCGFSSLHVPPLPSAWQGPFRQTSKDWFCAGNQRNTAVVLARTPYIVYVDDLSVLMPGWFNQVRHALIDGYVVCGAYKKVKQLRVGPTGNVESYEPFPPGVDSRWSKGSDGGVVPWVGSGLFGCSFGVPLEAMLEVDGNDRACDGAGAEDYDLGIRLERAGYAFFYNRNMLTLESEEDHGGEASLPRAAKVVTPDRLPKGYDGNPMSDHVMLNRVCHEDRILPIVGAGLRAVRERYLETGLVPIPREPQTDWRDGAPLKDL